MSNGYNTEKRYSQVPQLSDTRYSAKGKWRYHTAKRDFKAPSTRDFNIWLCGRQLDLSVVRLTFIRSIDMY